MNKLKLCESLVIFLTKKFEKLEDLLYTEKEKIVIDFLILIKK